MRAQRGAGESGTMLDTAVTYLTGVGPARADALRRLGIFTARDLFMHIPHRYEDASTDHADRENADRRRRHGDRHGDLERRDSHAKGASRISGRGAGRERGDRSVVARPAVSRSRDQERRRAAAHRSGALFPRPRPRAARVRESRPGRCRDRNERRPRALRVSRDRRVFVQADSHAHRQTSR